MSDFIFSSKAQQKNHLSNALATIYVNDKCDVKEFHGDWGSVAVTQSNYNGFQPLETDQYICLVLGGPVLYFQDNSFLGGDDPQAGSKAILKHWCTNKADWSEDLSGPYVVLIIDKLKSSIECITDLMMFIPVYKYQKGKTIFWGTHVDALALACGQNDFIDETSLVDFILHNTITFPYTAYSDIYQLQPASLNKLFKYENVKNYAISEPKIYWLPCEGNKYNSIQEAATELSYGVQQYIKKITNPLNHVAQFISAGEDSRVLTGMLPPELKRDAYIFLDSMNREGKIASKVANIYRANFKPDYRSKNHYLDILPEASALVGLGHQYIHSHTLGFDKKHKLKNYRAVFGGYIADSLLKAQYTKKPKLLKKLAFLPQYSISGENRTSEIKSNLFPENILKNITKRRREHFAIIKQIRPISAHEWFELWPATMRVAIPNLYSNRRLFASYEVFMAKEVIKISANVPVSWKLNRRLFNTAFRTALAKSKFVFHADGRLPYYPWWINTMFQGPVWLYQQVGRRTGLQSNQGPWADWKTLINSEQWQLAVKKANDSTLPNALKKAINTNDQDKIVPNYLINYKINLLQACYQISKKNNSKYLNG